MTTPRPIDRHRPGAHSRRVGAHAASRPRNARPAPPAGGGPALPAAALEAAARGWPVLPVWPPLRGGGCACRDATCGSAGKHPLGRLVPHGLLDATTDAARIARWWRRYPAANLGVATGAISGLVVIDVDPRHGGTAELAALEARHEPLPPTVEAVTGGGGRHLYFALDARHEDPVPTCANLLPGVDVRGEGGYVVSPPSLHASGRRYHWRPGHSPAERAPAPLPRWLAHVARAGAVPELSPAGAPVPWALASPPEPADALHAGLSGAFHAEIPRSLRAGRPLLPATPEDQATFRALMGEVGVRPRGRVQEMHRCPWHHDEHPSLSVHWQAAVFHCFGCEIGGGIGTLRRLVAGRGTPAARAGWPW